MSAMQHRSGMRKHGRNRGWVATTLVLLLGLSTMLAGTSLANHTSGISGTFESADGNLARNHEPALDWNSFFNNATLTGELNFGTQPDAAGSANDDQYAGGIKHDTACPGLATNNVHVKSDFSGFYIAHEKVGSDVFLYLAWHRVKQNNDTNSAHASFIFAQSDEACANGVTPVRTGGDMLVTYDFQGGATGVPTIGLSRWITTGPGANCETAKSVPCWGKVQNVTETGNADGAVNHRGIGSVFDSHVDAERGVVEFGEAAVNLTGAGVFTPNQCDVRFGSVHVGSRASGNSFDAQLKDLVRPLDIDLDDCAGLIVKKVTDPADAPQAFDFAVEGDETDGQFALGHGDEEEFTQLNPGTYTITEDPADGFDLTDITCRRNGSEVGTVDLTAGTVDVALGANETITCTFTNTQRGSIVVEKVTEPAGLEDAFGFTAGGGLSPTTFTLGDGDTRTYSNLLPGSYTVTEDDPSPHFALTAIDCDDTNSSGDTESRTATYQVEPGETVTCAFTNAQQLGSLLVHKVDDDGALLGGATFTATPGAGDPISLTENPDGVHCVDGLELGADYVVSETVVPDGYTGAGDETLTVTSTATCAERITDEDAPDWTFENEQLHKVMVIVCHEGTDTLVEATVTDADGAERQTPGGEASDELCALADDYWFTDKEHGPEDYGVDIPGHDE